MKKLVLKKTVVANLSSDAMDSLKGGVVPGSFWGDSCNLICTEPNPGLPSVGCPTVMGCIPVHPDTGPPIPLVTQGNCLTSPGHDCGTDPSVPCFPTVGRQPVFTLVCEIEWL